MALSRATDWRWLREGETTPWYPTMRLFRQNRWGDWAEVFERIARELHDEIGHAGFDADLCKGTVAIVAEQLRASQARAEEQVRVAVVVVVAPRRAEGGESLG